MGFDIYENKVFWSDTRNDKGMGTSQGDLEKGNSDIFMYDLRTDQITQITQIDQDHTAWGIILWRIIHDELVNGYLNGISAYTNLKARKIKLQRKEVFIQTVT